MATVVSVVNDALSAVPETHKSNDELSLSRPQHY